MSDNHELLRKIKALADKGFAGEAAAASNLLERLCAKHGIDAAALDSERMKGRRFKADSGEHDTFIGQVIASVVGKRPQFTGGKHSTIVEMTDAEFVEVEAKAEFFWKDYQEQKELFWAAYVQRQKLFVKPSPDDPKSSRNSEEALRVLRMAESIEKKNFQKRLEVRINYRSLYFTIKQRTKYGSHRNGCQ